MKEVKVNDIIQIVESSDSTMVGVLMVVEEQKSFGVQASVKIPFQEGVAYFRVNFSEFEVVGVAVMTTNDDGD